MKRFKLSMADNDHVVVSVFYVDEKQFVRLFGERTYARALENKFSLFTLSVIDVTDKLSTGGVSEGASLSCL